MAELQYDAATGEVVGGEVSEGTYSPQAPAVPAEPWDRLYAAAELGLRDPQLPARLKAETLALFEPGNLFTLAVILAAWAGASIVGGPVAWVANLGLGALGLYAIGEQIVSAAKEMGDYAVGAYQAKTAADLQAAGRHFGAALVELGDLVITSAFNVAAFKGVRAIVVRRFKVPQRAPQERAPQERAPQERAPQERAPQERAPQERAPQERAPQERAPRVPDVLVGTGAGAAGRELAGVLPLVAGGLGVVAAVALGGWLLSRRRRRRSE